MDGLSFSDYIQMYPEIRAFFVVLVALNDYLEFSSALHLCSQAQLPVHPDPYLSRLERG